MRAVTPPTVESARTESTVPEVRARKAAPGRFNQRAVHGETAYEMSKVRACPARRAPPPRRRARERGPRAAVAPGAFFSACARHWTSRWRAGLAQLMAPALAFGPLAGRNGAHDRPPRGAFALALFCFLFSFFLFARWASCLRAGPAAARQKLRLHTRAPLPPCVALRRKRTSTQLSPRSSCLQSRKANLTKMFAMVDYDGSGDIDSQVGAVQHQHQQRR